MSHAGRIDLLCRAIVRGSPCSRLWRVDLTA
jgi:hypothetical protein